MYDNVVILQNNWAFVVFTYNCPPLFNKYSPITRVHVKNFIFLSIYILLAVAKNPMLHANLMALFYRTSVMATRSFTLRE